MIFFFLTGREFERPGLIENLGGMIQQRVGMGIIPFFKETARGRLTKQQETSEVGFGEMFLVETQRTQKDGERRRMERDEDKFQADSPKEFFLFFLFFLFCVF